MKVINIIEIIVILIVDGMIIHEKFNDDTTFTLIYPVGLLFTFVLVLALLCDLYPESIVAVRKLLLLEV